MKCYICHEQKDELIFPIIGDLTEENLCSDCCSQYENLLSIEENYENISESVSEIQEITKNIPVNA